MNRLVDMGDIEVVGVVKAQPLSLSRQGKSRIRRHLQQVGWRFAWFDRLSWIAPLASACCIGPIHTGGDRQSMCRVRE
jgi:hypothetical protein